MFSQCAHKIGDRQTILLWKSLIEIDVRKTNELYCYMTALRFTKIHLHGILVKQVEIGKKNVNGKLVFTMVFLWEGETLVSIDFATDMENV